MLRTEGAPEDDINALDAGADDCISAPFRFREMVARLGAVLRRRPTENSPKAAILRAGDLELDLKQRQLRRAGRDVHLSRLEFELLFFLMENRDVPLTHLKLLRGVWKEDFAYDPRWLRFYISLPPGRRGPRPPSLAAPYYFPLRCRAPSRAVLIAVREICTAECHVPPTSVQPTISARAAVTVVPRQLTTRDARRCLQRSLSSPPDLCQCAAPFPSLPSSTSLPSRVPTRLFLASRRSSARTSPPHLSVFSAVPPTHHLFLLCCCAFTSLPPLGVRVHRVVLTPLCYPPPYHTPHFPLHLLHCSSTTAALLSSHSFPSPYPTNISYPPAPQPF